MNAAEERAASLRARAAQWRRDGEIDAAAESAIAARFEQPWRTHGALLQLVFFALAAIGLGATLGFFKLFDIPLAGVFVGAAAIFLAEKLIRSWKWFSTGVEAALWLGGLVAAITELPSSGTPESLLVIASAFAVSGARVRNPILGCIAAVLVMAWAEWRFDLGVIAALLAASLAVVALLRTWQRASTEWLFIFTALALPIAGRFTAGLQWRTTTIALYAGYGVVVLTLALLKRHHALFFSAGIALAIAATDLGRTLAAPPEALFAAAGASLLTLSFVFARALKGHTRGLVSTPASLTSMDGALEVAGTLALQPQAQAPPPAAGTGGGGFGGAGASGDY